MRKVITGLVLGLATLTIVSTTSPKTTEAKTKYYTVKEAGKKIYNLQKTAYKKKVKKTITIKFKCKSDNAATNFIGKAFDEAAKFQYGTAYRKGLKATSDTMEPWNNENGSHFNKKDKVFVYKFTINGKHKDFRFFYRDDECLKKLATELQGLTKGKNQFEKAWITMVWLRQRVGYNGGKNADGSYYAMYNRHAGTKCEGLARRYANFAYLAGVKTVGTVASDKDNHMWNWVKIDGKRYYIDATGETRGRAEDIVEYVKNCCVPFTDETYEGIRCSDWRNLDRLNEWYKKNVDADAKEFNTCKECWNLLTAEQKKKFKDYYDMYYLVRFEYDITCNSYAQSRLLPLNVFRETYDDLSKPKTWKYEVIKNGSSELCK